MQKRYHIFPPQKLDSIKKTFYFLSIEYYPLLYNCLVESELIFPLSARQIFVYLIIIHLKIHFVPFVQSQDHVGRQIMKVLARYVKVSDSSTSALQFRQIDLTFVQFQLRQNVIDLPESVFVQFQDEIVARVADCAMSIVLGPVIVIVTWRLFQQPFQEFSEAGYHF